MFIIIRLLLSSVFFVVFDFFVKKIKIVKKKRKLLIVCVFSVVFYFSLCFLPFENTFITFTLPEKSFEYFYYGKDGRFVVEGNNTALVVGVEQLNNVKTYMIIPKNNNGWKVGIGVDTKSIIYGFNDGIVYQVYQYKNSNEYYVICINLEQKDVMVTDSLGNEFYTFCYTTKEQKEEFIYIGYINKLDENYSIMVNGETINIGHKKQSD